MNTSKEQVRPLNISNEVIRIASGVYSYNTYTKDYVPFYTRPDGQNIEQAVYLDEDWAKRANIQYNSPNNLRCILIGTDKIIATYYKPVKFISKDGKLIQRKFNAEKYPNWLDVQKAIQPIKWLKTPRIYQNIEEIIFDIKLFKSMEQIESMKQFIIQEISQDTVNFQRLKAICAIDLKGEDIKEICDKPSLIEGLQKLGLQLKAIYKTSNTQERFITRPEYYRYDEEVLKQFASVLNIGAEDKQTKEAYTDAIKLKTLIDKYIQEFGEGEATKMIQLQLREAINKRSNSIYQVDTIKKKIADELVESGNSRYVKYIQE